MWALTLCDEGVGSLEHAPHRPADLQIGNSVLGSVGSAAIGEWPEAERRGAVQKTRVDSLAAERGHGGLNKAQARSTAGQNTGL